MKQIDAFRPVWAPLLDETPSGNTYGPGIILGKFMNINYKKKYAEAQVYGDGRLDEDVKQPNGGDITLNVTELPFACASEMFGKETPTATETVTTGDDNRRYGCLSYINKILRDKKILYQVVLVYKTAFDEPDNTSTTKSGNIQLNTPSLTGVAYMPLDNKLDATFEFNTFAEAQQKQAQVCNLDADAAFVAQPMIFPDNGVAITAQTNIFLACTTPGASIYYTTDGEEPSASSTEYTQPFQLEAAGTVKAVAIKSGNSSAVSKKIYRF